MKKELMEILACPMCKSSLELEIIEEDENEIVTGTLKCVHCSESYPITETIPNLLPPDLRN